MRAALGLAPKKQTFVPAGIDKVALAKSLGIDPAKEPGTFEFISKALDHPLPEPWTEQVDSKKRVFYWNPVSRQSSWQHPQAGSHKALVVAYRRVSQAENKAAALEAEIEAFHRQAEDEIGKWRQSHAPDGTPYFYKVGTQLTRWDNPRDEVLMHMELRVRMMTDLGEEMGRPPQAPPKKKKKGKLKARQEAATIKIAAQAKVFLRRLALKKRAKARLVCQCLIRGFLGRCRARLVRELRNRDPSDPPGSPKKFASPMSKGSMALAASLHAEDGELVDLSEHLVLDEIGIKLGMNYTDPIDMAAFAMMTPLFIRPLPTPWQIVPHAHGRTDFYHPGMDEMRQQHPLFSFFAEMLAFLRAHSQTNVPIAEAMTAQIFREASPQVLRERLGVWEGPHEDPALPGGVFFILIVEGIDPAVPGGTKRRDDPRLEAASNVAARLAGWHHLWTGFLPDEPFPLLEGRLAALAAQLAEAVVVAPGPAAEALLELMATRQVLPKPESPRWTPEEAALQPLVVGMLGKAYGLALSAAGMAESADIRNRAPEVIVYSDSEEAYEEDPAEAADSEEEEYEDDVEDEVEQTKDEAEETSAFAEGESDKEDDLDDLAHSAATSPTGARSPLRGQFDFPDEDLLKTEEPRETQGFLPKLKVESAAGWAEHALRPITPPPGQPKEEPPKVPISPGMKRRNLQRFGVGEDLWAQGLPSPKPIVQLSVGTLVCGAPDDEDQALDGTVPVEQTPPLELPPPPKPSVLAARNKEKVKIDDFAKSLAASSAMFDAEVVSAEPTCDEQPWSIRRIASADAAPPPSSRSKLEGVFVAPKGATFDEDEGVPRGTDPDVRTYKGCAARPNTPTQGPSPKPPHLQHVAEPKPKTLVPLHMVGSRARANSAGRERTGTRSKPFDCRPRPDSAGPRARKPCRGLLPDKPDALAVAAAKNVKAFLSRSCGTMQFALNVFDPSGDGRFDRMEWELGLKKLNYIPTFDVQAMFTALDKRRHHVLTLSDLLDKYSGMNVFTGIPPPGLRGIASEILHEAMGEALGDVVTEALQEALVEPLQNPSGPQRDLPDIKSFLKRMERERKKASKTHVDKSKSDKASTKKGGKDKSPTGHGRKQPTSPSKEPHSAASSRKTSPTTSPIGARGKKKKVNRARSSRHKKKGGRGSSAGSASSRGSSRRGSPSSRRGSPSSHRGSPSSHTSRKHLSPPSGKKGKRKGKGINYDDNGIFSLGGRGSAVSSCSSRLNSSQSARPRRRKDKRGFDESLFEDRSASTSSIDRDKYMRYLQELRLQEGQDDVGQSLGRLPRQKGKQFHNGFSGYSFVDNPDFFRDENRKLQPWMPRPVEDVCKTYGHIFRLLTDPRVRSMQAKGTPQKHSINVSVPQIPSLYSTGGSFAESVEDSVDLDELAASEGDAYDAQAPLPAVRQTAGPWRSKSSPGLLTGLSGASTTAGPFRPASFGTAAGSSGSSDVSLPTLATTAPMHVRPDQHPLDGMNSGIDAQSRRSAGLLAGTL
mmetsp:Transcript_36077/g.90732  ORF Transcript_36077/g.90732 Transcript_36077/m.90732 type:complete len:1501 (+) Transcript_36077:71-4573(+)|eukprot:CAMPEP_0115410802 /NCGR_PEP_ID=MMETSP0271-20121206/20707_1 /TAXON_ID=71861 /ORGANISM="Scrippsiella trochoidea, Strain CCMP3099" /LENGTH=1500 /DNA_ID=CAMNT_0002834991 /DNA_START=48 /DNA_END=4550 /DNA_ORIENTATION=+